MIDPQPFGYARNPLPVGHLSQRRPDRPYANHNGGWIAFGPDNYLFIGLGDGGSAGDPEDHGQNPQTLLGSCASM
jgi:glucose/arabinose dehydrogenase